MQVVLHVAMDEINQRINRAKMCHPSSGILIQWMTHLEREFDSRQRSVITWLNRTEP
jgi:hypothetical protein